MVEEMKNLRMESNILETINLASLKGMVSINGLMAMCTKVIL